jgi:hypothetical protein
MTEPVWRATAAILEALNADQTDKVIIIAHSQGTIIVANVLRAIAKALESELTQQEKPRWHGFTNQLMGAVNTDTQVILRNNLAHSLSKFAKGGVSPARKKLHKLEIFTFANCADKMRYIYPARQLPYMEHFANQHDLVARLGVLSPFRDNPKALIEIEGPVYEQKDGWGHLLNEHYLAPIDSYLYPANSKQPRPDNPYAGVDQKAPTPRLYGYFHGNHPPA